MLYHRLALMPTAPSFARCQLQVVALFTWLAVLPPEALAQTTNWTEAGGTDNWSDNNNWSNGRPQSGSMVVFRPDGAPDNQFVDFDQSASVASLQVRDNADTFNNSSVFTTIDGRGGTQLSISGPLEVSSGSSLFGAGSATLVLNGMNVFANSLETTDTLTTNGPGDKFLRLVDTQLVLNDNGTPTTPSRSLTNLVLRLESDSFLANLGDRTLFLSASSQLEFANGGVLGWDGAVSAPVTVESGDARIAGSTSISGNVIMNESTTSLTFGASDGLTPGSSSISGDVGGSGRVVVDPSYTLTLSGNNSFTGGLFLRGGTARVGAGPNLGGLTNFVQFEGGTLATTQSFTIVIDAFVGGDGGAIDTTFQNVRLEGTLTGPSVASAGDLTKRGAGALTLAAANNGFFGDFVVEQGTLIAEHGDSVGVSSFVEVQSGATLRFDSGESLGGITGDGTVDLNGQSVAIAAANQNGEFAGALTGSGALIKQGTGDYRFSGDNSAYTGAWVLDAGRFRFGLGLSLSGDLAIDAGKTIFFDPESGESDYAHSLSGEGNVFMSGSGAINLTGDNSGFTGTLFLTHPAQQGGALNVDGTIAPSVLGIEGGATLGGGGNILGTATALSGTIRPDAAAARLRVDDVDFRSGSTFGIDIASASEYSTLRVLGDAVVNDATLDVDLLDGFLPAHGDSFLVFHVDGSVSGSGLSSFDLPVVPGMEWDTSQLLTNGLISIDVTLPGDYNADGTVDAADYTVWRDNLGEPAGALPSDIDGGVIGQAQYDTWVAHFGQSVPTTTAAVPEPGALVLFAGFLAAAYTALQRRAAR